METRCFIGSDKNSGKTTAFTYVYEKMHRQGKSPQICVTGIGINGEDVDEYGGGKKPTIRLLKGSYFITRGPHLHHHTGKYETIMFFDGLPFDRSYVMGRCLADFPLVLEGPNSGGDLLLLKEKITKILPEGSVLLIDGSLDRQFLASPLISDMFYFSVLFSKRAPQMEKTRGFLRSLQISTCSPETGKRIMAMRGDWTKSLLLNCDGGLSYHGTEIPYCDDGLHLACKKMDNGACLYLNGALTRSLYDFLAPFKGLELVLDNFTLYQMISTSSSRVSRFLPNVSLLHPLHIKEVFVKQEVDFDSNLLPDGVPVRNIFRTVENGNAPGI